MQIIIPMAGTGQRFLDAGHSSSKPLIEVDGKPIIEHVIDLFPNESNFIFICNKEHLRLSDMRKILENLAPSCRILPIDSHKKGPVYTVLQALNYIDDKDEAIVNYCDFSKYWNYSDFLKHTHVRNADGAISAYKGFHPHMLGSTQYAFIRDDKQWLTEIREKRPFTSNRMEEYASDGTYYFKRGSYIKKYFKMLMEKDININGEYYISMAYNLLKSDGLKVSIYEIQHMLQWGTPEDLEEYGKWSRYFRDIVDPARAKPHRCKGINLIPLAGAGKRFNLGGYSQPKPLIEVSGKPMVIQAAHSLPPSEKYVFVCRKEHVQKYGLDSVITGEFASAEIVELDDLTEGQACTCQLGLANQDQDSPLLIGASDNGFIWDGQKYQNLIKDKSIDAVVWSFRRHPSSMRNPESYGWIRVDENDTVLEVSVKKPISDKPYEDHAITGAFFFRKARYFLEAFEKLRQKNIRVNNEFYVDSVINEIVRSGLKVRVFEVDNYICWGSPDDLKTYEYWQSFFHKNATHPYKLDKDPMMAKTKIAEYEKRYSAFAQEYT